MKRTEDVIACVVDHGQFTYVAERLARDFKQVFYYSPLERAMPVIREGIVGDGLDGVTRVASPWSVVADLYVFPDIGFTDLQLELDRQGAPVWGAIGCDWLESSRGSFLDYIKEIGMEVPPHTSIEGISKLREYLKDSKDVYVKISRWRGDWETFHWRSWDEDEIGLVKREVALGPLKEHITFYVFDAIDIAVEDGVDTWCIDGKWPGTVIHGMEAKDKFFIGTFAEFDSLPDEIRMPNEKLSKLFDQEGYRGAFSTEVCITKDKTPYFTDPTCRFGSPPSQIQMEMIANWGDIVWAGANGVCVDPEPVAKFGIQGVIELAGEGDEWTVGSEWATLTLPKELKRWVKCSFCGSFDDRVVFSPAPGICRHWMVGIGNTIMEAVDHFADNANQLPDGACCSMQGLPKLLDEIRTAEHMGMEFTDQAVPTHTEIANA